MAHRSNYSEEIKTRYREPIWCLHRIDLQKGLVKRAEELGVRLHFGSCVRDVDFERRVITCENGYTEEGDLMIAADGLWSTMRQTLVGQSFVPQPTGDPAYRIVLTADQIDDDEELRSVMTQPGIRIWMGPGAHAVAYSLLGGQLLNIVLVVPDDLPQGIVKAKGDLGEMGRLFEGWDPLLRKFLSYVIKVEK